jgi:hypothetical protein
LVAAKGQQSMIADGNAMRVAADTTTHLRWSVECGLRINDRVFAAQLIAAGEVMDRSPATTPSKNANGTSA